MRFRICIPYTAGRNLLHPMPGWPTKQGMKCMTIEMREDLVQHIDEQADYQGMSRVAYLRQLVMKDMRRQGPGRPKA